MKTKEINVWVEDEYDELGNGEQGFHKMYETLIGEHGLKVIKAKLIIEIPERKIEITESQLDDTLDKLLIYEKRTTKQINYSWVKKELGFADEN